MSLNNMVGQAVSGTSVSDRVQRLAFETTWSNGEVVQRGTGANFGEDGFVRPSCSYRQLVDYLYARAVEHYEIGADLGSVLSRDWKSKFSAALVPRGLEHDELFYSAVTTKLLETVGEKYLGEAKAASSNGLVSKSETHIIEAELGRASQQWLHASFNFASGKNGSRNTGLLIESVLNSLKQLLDHAVEQRQTNSRISSELFHQPRSVDSLVDDFAVESQNFANGLTQSAALAAGALALGLNPCLETGIVSAILGVLGINTAFGSMTNISRYKNRNEEMRREINDKRMPQILKSVYSMMSHDERKSVPTEDNPFMNDIETLVTRFLANARYYGEDEVKVEEFHRRYEDFRAAKKDSFSVVAFADSIVAHFIADTFQHNAYLKDDLVLIFKAVDAMKMLYTKPKPAVKGLGGSSDLWQRLLHIQDPLAASIERGDIKHGFLRQHKWYQMALPVTLLYICSPLFGSVTIQGKIAGVSRVTSGLERAGKESPTFSRAVRDLKELNFATQESQIGSVMFFSAAIVFLFNVVFTALRLLQLATSPDWVDNAVMAAGWAALGGIIGANIALFHFVRKLRHLFGLLGSLASFQDPRLEKVRLATRTQIALTFVRVLTVLLAVTALIWTLVGGLIDDGDTPSSSSSPPECDMTVGLNAIIALAAVLVAFAALLFFFLVEFSVRYNLDPKLGETVRSKQD